ncbi:hypothetical protein CAPTEDRAFT_97316 [Capitella teleta]|uniref:DNA-directed RNA polymerase RBP11-like dimerisation domain-containing protein n=1 Tax=Capitella teleta TaxID=283909 RepID=R7UXV4_CAPTE|nr:hypothetical protein CAPTEDRAFT_97316 [Capitella teleta]|eukprot:ELU08251.1 hypothetical protein CAPTEDRAFT_97316 [Capitella teleta]
MILLSLAVEFCGYSVPHPSETKINLRIQTKGTNRVISMSVLEKGLNDLKKVSKHVLDTFQVGSL